ncbi:MAG TPA: lamin tail domain-containing protein, partial [Candidatus Sulfotelmatobacter sp.]|nr:lamin tail domain-containing protein [Candidatus Sulfotelmatobacter sp.]
MRYRLLPFLTVLFAAQTSLVPGAIVINEIHYDPDVKTEHVEFVELYNNGTNTVDLSGWYFSSGPQFTFPQGTTIGPGGYQVVTQDPAALFAKFGYAGA